MTKTPETTPAPTDAPAGRQRVSEALESLTGFETIGIEEHWGRGLDAVTGTQLTIGMVAVQFMRDGMARVDAWRAAKALTLRELNGYFEPDPDVETDDDESGKG